MIPTVTCTDIDLLVDSVRLGNRAELADLSFANHLAECPTCRRRAAIVFALVGARDASDERLALSRANERAHRLLRAKLTAGLPSS